MNIDACISQPEQRGSAKQAWHVPFQAEIEAALRDLLTHFHDSMDNAEQIACFT